LKIVRCEFSLKKFRFSQEIFSEEQIVGLSLKRLLEEYSFDIIDYASLIREADETQIASIEKFRTIYQLKR
jgi:hypothetical protein